jgi:hypothetical protein
VLRQKSGKNVEYFMTCRNWIFSKQYVQYVQLVLLTIFFMLKELDVDWHNFEQKWVCRNHSVNVTKK